MFAAVRSEGPDSEAVEVAEGLFSDFEGKKVLKSDVIGAAGCVTDWICA